MNNFIKISAGILLVYIMYIGTMLLLGAIASLFLPSVNYLILGLIGFVVASLIIYIIWLQWKCKNKLSEGE